MRSTSASSRCSTDRLGATLKASLRLAAAFLLPLNFALFAWLKVGGVATLNGLLRVGFVVVQIAGLLVLESRPGFHEELRRWGKSTGEATWMPPSAQLVFLAAAVVVLVLVFLRRTKAEQDSWWVLLAVFAGLYHAESGAPLFLTLAPQV